MLGCKGLNTLKCLQSICICKESLLNKLICEADSDLHYWGRGKLDFQPVLSSTGQKASIVAGNRVRSIQGQRNMLKQYPRKIKALGKLGKRCTNLGNKIEPWSTDAINQTLPLLKSDSSPLILIQKNIWTYLKNSENVWLWNSSLTVL